MKKISLIIIALTFIISCSSVSLLYSWKEEGYNQLNYKNILVLSVSERKAYNYFARMLDQSVVNILKENNIKAMGVSTTQLVGTQFPDSAQLNALAQTNHCDAILIVDLQDSRIERSVSSMYYGGYWGWGFGMGMPITYDDNILYFETRLIDLKNQNIVYLFNNSINYNSSNPQSSAQQLSTIIVNQLYPINTNNKDNKKSKK